MTVSTQHVDRNTNMKCTIIILSPVFICFKSGQTDNMIYKLGYLCMMMTIIVNELIKQNHHTVADSACIYFIKYTFTSINLLGNIDTHYGNKINKILS